MTKVEVLPLTCPFCGDIPIVTPDNPEQDGDAWGRVACENPCCPATPSVYDRINVADTRGSDKYKASAISRWNKRADKERPHEHL